MSLWEYKVITSGKGGFATPALLEKFLNDLGRDEWEIIHFQTPPDNFLAFTGLARRSTQRDWTLEDAAAAAAKVEAEKLRAEFEAKFKAASSSPAAGGVVEERAPSFLEEKSAPDDGFRKPVDTSRDDDPEAQEDDKSDDWDKLTAAEEDELPTFFDAIKPHMRRNQRGPGMSVGVDYLAKKWDQTEEDLKTALAECGFVVPADEDAKVEYLEYDGDLYWLNINRRGELWINTKEKPRPVFRAVKAARIEIEPPPAKDAGAAGEARPTEEKPENGSRKPEGDEPAAAGGTAADQPSGRPPKSEKGGGNLPEGPALLGKIRPHMRRNRRGPGGSGSTSFLSRALRTNEADLKAAFVALGFTLPGSSGEKPTYLEIGNELWWLNLDSRGGLWINGREKKDGETAASAREAGTDQSPTEGAPAASGAPAPEGAPAPSAEGSAPPAATDPASAATPAVGIAVATETAPAASVPASAETPAVAPTLANPDLPAAPAASVAVAVAPEPGAASPLTAVRLLLKESRTGSFAGRLDRLAEDQGRPAEDLLAALVAAGLKLPDKPREKPSYLPMGEEVIWLSKNARGELWLNAKPAKLADKDDDEDEADANGNGDDVDADGEKKSRRPRTKKKAE